MFTSLTEYPTNTPTSELMHHRKTHLQQQAAINGQLNSTKEACIFIVLTNLMHFTCTVKSAVTGRLYRSDVVDQPVCSFQPRSVQCNCLKRVQVCESWQRSCLHVKPGGFAGWRPQVQATPVAGFLMAPYGPALCSCWRQALGFKAFLRAGATQCAGWLFLISPSKICMPCLTACVPSYPLLTDEILYRCYQL